MAELDSCLLLGLLILVGWLVGLIGFYH
ncbi:unnamed protein product [Nyctereutes procyonoides]|uniref:(raccoon dog) hypothetical protein n=1 Tax=Nyctereutes procyonoides TaxID=34880 RepID=A0A811Y1C3_NYCPR|nr:unnamed protein product [Nyctereutes procyonoides]